MGQIVYCAWLIPCEHGVRLMPNPTYLLEGGTSGCVFVRHLHVCERNRLFALFLS
jgi:hypothetical protein